jgi:hypothetical protein
MLSRILLIATLLTGCASDTPGTVPVDAKPMDATQLQALMDRAGRDSLWLDDAYSGGLRFRFEPSGRLEVRSRYVTSKVVPGRWRVQTSPARLCTQVEQDAEKCHPVYQLPGERFYVDVPHLSTEANTFVLRPR